MKGTNNRAIGYCRVSTLEQSREGVSLDAQEERIRSYCRMAGIELVDVIREEGVSASVHLKARPRGKELLHRIKTEDIHHFVALKLDRVYRSAIDALTQTEQFHKKGIAVHFVDVQIDTSTPMGKLMLSIMSSFAELERDLIAERTKTALAHKKQTRKIYSHAPYGFDRVGEDLVENDQEQRVIGQMKEWQSRGISYRSMCNKLQDEGIRTKLGKEKWYPSTVKYILDNDLYQKEEEFA